MRAHARVAPASAQAWLVHPQPQAFMTFPGHLLHGVLPTACAPRPQQRLTLLIAWYAERTQGAARRRRLGPQSVLPRCTRSQTWPAALQLPAAAAAAPPPPPPAAVRLAVPEVSPAWSEVPPGEGCAGALLEVPPSLQQHFFLRRPDEVRARLFEEHGVGGSWAEDAAAAPSRKRSRA